MKYPLIVGVFTGLMLCFGTAMNVDAQEISASPNPADAAANFEANLKALEQTTPLPFSSMLENGRGGSFYSISHPQWPPLPGDVLGLPFWRISDDTFLLDDRSSTRSGTMMEADDSGPPVPEGGSEEGGGGGSGGGGLPGIDTNELYLEMRGISNGCALLRLHNTTNAVTYQLQMKLALNVNGTTNQPYWRPGEIITGNGTNVDFQPVPIYGQPSMFFRAIHSDVMVELSIDTDNDNTEIDPGDSTTFFIRLESISTNTGFVTLPTNLPVFYAVSGTAENGVDFTDGSGALLGSTNFIGSDSNQVNIEMDTTNVLSDPVFDLTVNLSLLAGDYMVDTNVDRLLIAIEQMPPTNLFLLVTNVNAPIGIDYNPATNALIISMNYVGFGGGQPFNLLRIGTNSSGGLVTNQWGAVSNAPDEVYFSIVKSNAAGFTNGDMYIGNSTLIDKLSANSAQWTQGWSMPATNTDVPVIGGLRGGFHMDDTGVFSNDLVVVAGNGPIDNADLVKGIWLVDSSGQSRMLTNIDTTHLEGVTTVPANPFNWGPWEGKIVSGDEQEKKIYTFDTNGIIITNFTDSDVFPAGFFPGSIRPEDFTSIPSNQDLYLTDPDTGNILKVSKNAFTNCVGDLLIMDAGEFGDAAKLFIVNWDFTNLTFDVRRVKYMRNDNTDGHLEHVSFAPLNLQTQ